MKRKFLILLDENYGDFCDCPIISTEIADDVDEDDLYSLTTQISKIFEDDSIELIKDFGECMLTDSEAQFAKAALILPSVFGSCTSRVTGYTETVLRTMDKKTLMKVINEGVEKKKLEDISLMYEVFTYLMDNKGTGNFEAVWDKWRKSQEGHIYDEICFEVEKVLHAEGHSATVKFLGHNYPTMLDEMKTTIDSEIEKAVLAKSYNELNEYSEKCCSR